MNKTGAAKLLPELCPAAGSAAQSATFPENEETPGFTEGTYEKTGKRYVVRVSSVVGELWPRRRRR